MNNNKNVQTTIPITMPLNHPKASISVFASYLIAYSRSKWKQEPVRDYIENRIIKLSLCMTELIHSNFETPTLNMAYNSFDEASHDCIRRIKISLRTGKKYNQSILKFYRQFTDRLCSEAKLSGTETVVQNYLKFKAQLKALPILSYQE